MWRIFRQGVGLIGKLFTLPSVVPKACPCHTLRFRIMLLEKLLKGHQNPTQINSVWSFMSDNI